MWLIVYFIGVVFIVLVVIILCLENLVIGLLTLNSEMIKKILVEQACK